MIAPTRVLVVDDLRVVREGLLMLLGLLDNVEVAGAAVDGQDAIDHVTEDTPEVVLMDLNMPRMDGIAATRRLSESYPHVPVVVLTDRAQRRVRLPGRYRPAPSGVSWRVLGDAEEVALGAGERRPPHTGMFVEDVPPVGCAEA